MLSVIMFCSCYTPIKEYLIARICWTDSTTFHQGLDDNYSKQQGQGIVYIYFFFPRLFVTDVAASCLNSPELVTCHSQGQWWCQKFEKPSNSTGRKSQGPCALLHKMDGHGTTDKRKKRVPCSLQGDTLLRATSSRIRLTLFQLRYALVALWRSGAPAAVHAMWASSAPASASASETTRPGVLVQGR